MKCGSNVAAMVLSLTVVSGLMAAEVNVSLDLASSYVFRGSTLNEGFVLQPGMEMSGLPFSIGVWGNFDLDNYDNTLSDGEFSEIDLYASYDIPLGLDPLGLALGYTEYTYPSVGGDADREVNVGFSLDTVLSPSVVVSVGVGGEIKQIVYVEASVTHAVEFGDEAAVGISAAVGHVADRDAEDGFSHYEVGVSASLYCVSASVTYIGQIDEDVLPDVDAGGSYDMDVVGILGVSYGF